MLAAFAALRRHLTQCAALGIYTFADNGPSLFPAIAQTPSAIVV